MDAALVTDLLTEIARSLSRPALTRDPIRVWSLSGVDRLTFPDCTTAIYKYAARPFTTEDQILCAASQAGIPVPAVLGSTMRGDVLGMVIDDLGDPIREARDDDGILAAVALHAAAPSPVLPELDEKALAALPGQALSHLSLLREHGRWTDATTADVAEMLHALADAAVRRAAGATLAPRGWVHSEFHPTSLHIGAEGWHLLDFARAFTGPGLLDLASWHGTLDDADPDRLRAFLEAYVTADGAPDTLTGRGGLTAQAWALGWHRVWIIEWFLEQAVRWINDPSTDDVYLAAVRRHLRAAVTLLQP